MSGDVQTKRRRDKKKKKEEQTEETIIHPQPPPTPTITNDDVNIHVHKERSLGGGACAKCIFFVLMMVISFIIGFTITEHRGQTDVDIPTSQSRFASIFEGWTDKSPDAHDDEDGEMHGGSEEVSHEEDDNDIEHGIEDEEDEDEEEEEEEEEESNVSDEAQVEEFEPEYEMEYYEDEEDEEDVDPEDEDQTADDDEEQIGSEENQIGESEEYQNDEAEEDIDAEQSEQSEQSEQDEENASDEQANDDNVRKTRSKEITEDLDRDQDIREQEDDVEDPENDNIEENIIEDNLELNSASMAVKFGVGVSLFIVAYIVLVKKWRSDKVSEQDDTIKQEQVPDLSRRNTFVPPPTLEEIEQDIENVDEEYSDEEEGEESDDERKHIPTSKKQYEDLRTTYNRSLTPDSESEYSKKNHEDYEDEEEEEGEDGEEYDYDDREQEEEEEEDEEDYEIDEELMKKLEARYGKFEAKTSKYSDEEEDGDEEEVDEDDDDRFKSWKRIKSGTNEDVESESEDDKDIYARTKKTGAQSVYEFENITNADDYAIRDDLDKAQRHLGDKIQLALSLFTKILEKYPNSPRALYGKARALDLWADVKRSNEILQESIQFYLQALNIENTPDALFLSAGERCINRMRFVGNYGRAVNVHRKLIERFPNESKYKNELAVTYLIINRIPEARSILFNILQKWPNDGFALVHYGFILKTVDNKLQKAVEYLKRGIATRETGVIDGRFYFHLGDALARLGKRDEAMKIYEDGVENKVFLSKYQRSLYNVDRLTARPWWDKEQTPYTRLYEQLEWNYRQIRDEALSVLNTKGYFKDESENLRDVGDWKQFELYARGIKHVENCKKCPKTCKIIDSEPDVKGCRRGQVKFSVMHPGTHVWPHCGPTNCRLRIHLGLKVPPKTYIRVAEETRAWKEGKIFIFDDSFEHEVWHNGTEFRLVLIVDVWHPELTISEKYHLTAI